MVVRDGLPAFLTRERDAFVAGWCAGEVWVLPLERVNGSGHGEMPARDKDGEYCVDWQQRVQNAAEERFMLCEAGSGFRTDAGVSVMSCLGKFVFISVKNGSSKAPLQIFDLSPALRLNGGAKPIPVQVKADGKQRGLCAVAPLADKSGRILLASGHGKGIGHLWLFDGAGASRQEGSADSRSLAYLGRLNITGHTILGMQFSKCCRFILSVANEMPFAQKWELPEACFKLSVGTALASTPFDLRAGQSEKVPYDLVHLGAALGDDLSGATQLVANVSKAMEQRPDVAAWIAAQEEKCDKPRESDWSVLFPPRLVDPHAYDGDIDKSGLPHGFGVQAYDGDVNRVYEGDWRHGLRHGKGQIIDLRSGTVLFSGGWKSGAKHGFGIEVRPATGERYDGWFRDDKRHGIGSLVMSNKDSNLAAANRAARKRVRVVGFFREGKRHGLSWTTFPKECPAVPFAVTPGSIAHLLPIRCMMRYEQGSFFREFGYHRVDAVPLSAADKALLNFKPSQRLKAFSKHDDGHWAHGECWACLEEELDENVSAGEMLVCGNPTCRMRVHNACLGHSNARRLFLTKQSEDWYCNDLKQDQLEALRAHRPPKDMWFCPRPDCQALAAKECFGSFSNAESRGENKDAANIQEGTPDMARSMVKVRQISRDKKKVTSKSAKTKRRKITRKPERKKQHSEIDAAEIEAALRSLTPDPSESSFDSGHTRLADLKARDLNGRLQFFDSRGDAHLVDTEADLEEAMEIARLTGVETLHLYRCPC